MPGQGGPGGGMEADASAMITISGGNLTIDADGDGIDSNGSFTMSGGNVYVAGPTNDGNGALDTGEEATITGGTIIAVGSSGMATSFSSSSSQASVMVYLDSATTGTVSLKDSSGAVIASFDTDKQYSSVVISTPDLLVGEKYTLVCGSQETSVEVTDTVTQGRQRIWSDGWRGRHGYRRCRCWWRGRRGRHGYRRCRCWWRGRRGRHGCQRCSF
ncbi:MAG: hypothetical protein ACOX4F_06055 [Atopobiaceae bacterium]